jgi:hypothetical protein
MVGVVNIRKSKVLGKADSIPCFIQRMIAVQLVCPQFSYDTCGVCKWRLHKVAWGTLHDRKTPLNQERCENDNRLQSSMALTPGSFSGNLSPQEQFLALIVGHRRVAYEFRDVRSEPVNTSNKLDNMAAITESTPAPGIRISVFCREVTNLRTRQLLAC